MTATLEQIHDDPEILDRAIERNEPLDIVSDGVVPATVLPKVPTSIEEVRFAAQDWTFSVGTPMSRDERNFGCGVLSCPSRRIGLSLVHDTIDDFSPG